LLAVDLKACGRVYMTSHTNYFVTIP